MKNTPSVEPQPAQEQRNTAQQPQYHIGDEIDCLKRELKLRQVNYPKWVAAGRMKQESADYEIAVLQSALNRLKSLAYLLNQTLPIL